MRRLWLHLELLWYRAAYRRHEAWLEKEELARIRWAKAQQESEWY